MVEMVVLAAVAVGQAQLVQAEPLHHLVKVTQAAALMFPTSTAVAVVVQAQQAQQEHLQVVQVELVQLTRLQVLR
jgi:hypothetical protein